MLPVSSSISVSRESPRHSRESPTLVPLSVPVSEPVVSTLFVTAGQDQISQGRNWWSGGPTDIYRPVVVTGFLHYRVTSSNR